jgi:hypothetical protein
VLHYPKMPGSAGAPSAKCVAFEKLDGTNLHWCWHRDFGWHAFGTRRDEFDRGAPGVAAFSAAHPGLDDANAIFDRTLADPLDALLRDRFPEFEEVKAFAEYLGPNSFAGAHDPRDEKCVVLFDVWAEGYGFVGPERFVEAFASVPIPRVLYRGKLTGAFLESVRAGAFGVSEGAVCKGGTGGADVWTLKVKTYAYLARLKASFGARWVDYAE